jgi:hypothetical protein
VYEVQTQIATAAGGSWKTVSTAWYEPSTGYWSSTYAGHPTLSSAYTGTRFWGYDTNGLLDVTTGSAGYLEEDARPDFYGEPGVAIAAAWLRPSAATGSRKGLSAVHQGNGGLVITASLGSSGQGRLRVLLAPPVTLAEATAHGAFPPPPDHAAVISKQVRPGSAAGSGQDVYWFGSQIGGQTVRAAYTTTASAAAQRVHDGPSGGVEYEAIYRPRSLPDSRSGRRPIPYPTPDDPENDLRVTTTRPGSIQSQLASGSQTVHWWPATLGDGEKAQVTVYENAVVYVKTATAIIHFQFGMSLGADDTQDGCNNVIGLVAFLVPVGYSGLDADGHVSPAACTPPPLGLEGPIGVIGPPPGGVRTALLAGARPPVVLSHCAPTDAGVGLNSTVLYQASACSPKLAHVSQFCYHFADADGAYGSNPQFIRVQLEPSTGNEPASCHFTAETGLYALRPPAQGYVLVFVTRTPVCGPVQGPTGRVPALALETLLPGLYRPTCN